MLQAAVHTQMVVLKHLQILLYMQYISRFSFLLFFKKKTLPLPLNLDNGRCPFIPFANEQNGFSTHERSRNISGPFHISTLNQHLTFHIH
jgi:hypothetical protein